MNAHQRRTLKRKRRPNRNRTLFGVDYGSGVWSAVLTHVVDIKYPETDYQTQFHDPKPIGVTFTLSFEPDKYVSTRSQLGEWLESGEARIVPGPWGTYSIVDGSK